MDDMTIHETCPCGATLDVTGSSFPTRCEAIHWRKRHEGHAAPTPMPIRSGGRMDPMSDPYRGNT